MKPKTLPRPVYIRWTDSAAMHGWAAFSALEKVQSSECETVAWLIAERRESVVVSATVSFNHSESNSPMAIPRAAIQEIVDVALKQRTTETQRHRKRQGS
ncbi:MAG: hypothetical protein ABSE73_11800 [Planctomycetota bacterium]